MPIGLCRAGAEGGEKRNDPEGRKTDLHEFHHASCGTKEPLKLEFEQVYYDAAAFNKFCQSLKTTALLELVIAWGDNLLSVHCSASEGKRNPPREF